MDERKEEVKTEGKRLLIRIAGITTVAAVLLIFVLGIYVNHGNQMYPSIRDGDLCFTYKLGGYTATDPVAYKLEGRTTVGRIVAIGGDTVVISDGNLTVNGTILNEKVLYDTTSENAKVDFPYTVPEGSYFILNDYREDENDSRMVGAVTKKDLKGKVVMILRKRGI